MPGGVDRAAINPARRSRALREGAATVKIVASDWIDYLHLARYDGRWLIVNVLWELKPR